MKGYLITPPAMLPESPPISIAVLKGYLKQDNSNEFSCLDLSLDFFYYISDKITINDSNYSKKNELGLKIATLDYLNNVMIFNSESMEYEFVYCKKELSHWSAPFPFSYCEMVPLLEINSLKLDYFLGYEKNIYVGYTKKLLENKKIMPKDVEFIGFSIIGFFQVIPALTIAKYLKSVNSKVSICFGGPWVTLYSDKLSLLFSDNPLSRYIDFFSIAEGEYSIEKIISYLKKEIDYYDIPNALVKIGNTFIDTNNCMLLDTKDLSFPDYSDFELEKYFSFIEGQGRLGVQSSRGCYHNKCSFCNALTNLNCKQLRQKNIKLFINELKMIKKLYPEVKIIDFADSVSSKYRLMKLSDFFFKNKLGWEIDIRFENWVDDELIKAVKLSNGLLRFGMETVSQRLLDLHGKGNNMLIVSEIIERCKRNNYKPYIMTIVGLPSETFGEAKELEQFLINYIDDCEILVEDFNLERKTDIYFNPEKYGIKLMPDISFLNVPISFLRKEGYSSDREKVVYESIFMSIMRASYKDLVVNGEFFEWKDITIFINIQVLEQQILYGKYNNVEFLELNPHFKQALYSKGIYIKNMAAVVFNGN